MFGFKKEPWVCHYCKEDKHTVCRYTIWRTSSWGITGGVKECECECHNWTREERILRSTKQKEGKT